ncbi:MAG: 16S rRNA (guanine(527)-N(7))-methyltransferase RsmG [Anaerolineales bacterium]
MDKLVQDAQALFNVHLTGRQVIALTTYERELIEWNQKFNLTAIRDAAGIRTKHFLDSFSCVLAWKANPPVNIIDIGTGAGFPGIPLKIIYPNTKVTLVESVGKKAMFCQHILSILGLEGVEVINSRAEDLGQIREHREGYEWGIARAVANMRVLSEYLLPLVQVGGSMLAQKGESGPAEVHSAENAIKLLGGEMRQLLPVTLPGVVEERHLVVVDKVATTPPGYPRKPGVPAKKPLS